jgi:hypothetical protein
LRALLGEGGDEKVAGSFPSSARFAAAEVEQGGGGCDVALEAITPTRITGTIGLGGDHKSLLEAWASNCATRLRSKTGKADFRVQSSFDKRDSLEREKPYTREWFSVRSDNFNGQNVHRSAVLSC